MLDSNYAQALKEVYEILKVTDKELVKQIPKSFKMFIIENKDDSYSVNVNTNIPILEQRFKPETSAILALIYRRYWATLEEKKEFELSDRQALEEIERKKLEESPVDIKEILKPKKYHTEEIEEEKPIENHLIVAQEENIFQKIWSKIKAIIKFRK